MESAHRRESDKKNDLIKRIVLYGSAAAAISSIFGILAYGASAYVNLANAIKQAPENMERIEKIERWKVEQEEQSYAIQWWMSQIGKKLQIPAPPPRRRHFKQDQGDD